MSRARGTSKQESQHQSASDGTLRAVSSRRSHFAPRSHAPRPQALNATSAQPPLRCLIIDDDQAFLRFVETALEAAGIRPETAPDPTRGMELLKSTPPGSFDAILLDVSMPTHSGWETLIAIRELGDETPVIFVTASESVADRVRGLRMGADDFVVKPVAYEELVARVEAVVRRRRALTPLEFGDVRLDLARRRVERGGKEVFVSPREFDLLLALVRAKGEVLSRSQLLREVWDIEFDTDTNVLDVHLGRLRRKIDRHGRPLIQTVEKVGYRAIAYPRPTAAH